MEQGFSILRMQSGVEESFLFVRVVQMQGMLLSARGHFLPGFLEGVDDFGGAVGIWVFAGNESEVDVVIDAGSWRNIGRSVMWSVPTRLRGRGRACLFRRGKRLKEEPGFRRFGVLTWACWRG